MRTFSRRGKGITAAAAVLLAGVMVLPGGASATPALSARLAAATRVAKQATGGGYWVVSSAGVVTAFGGAHLYGSMVGRRLEAPIVGIVATSDGRGYWLVASDGGVFTFGDAKFSGSLGARFLGAPIVGMASSSGSQLAAAGIRGPQGARGPAGVNGAKGPRGLVGPMGVQGPAGARGANGSGGAPGTNGVNGANGLNGADGTNGGVGGTGATGTSTGGSGAPGGIGGTGATGGTGVAGGPGLTGGTGVAGGTGLTGGTGAVGGSGAPGPTGSANYGLIFNTGAQSVLINQAINFDSSGVLHGFGHTTPFLLQASVAGTYLVNFSVSAVETDQFALFVDGVLVPNTTYGSGAGTQQNNGVAILTLAAGDTISVVNHTSAATVTLQTLAGGTQTTVNASLVVTQLG